MSFSCRFKPLANHALETKSILTIGRAECQQNLPTDTPTRETPSLSFLPTGSASTTVLLRSGWRTATAMTTVYAMEAVRTLLATTLFGFPLAFWTTFGILTFTWEFPASELFEQDPRGVFEKKKKKKRKFPFYFFSFLFLFFFYVLGFGISLGSLRPLQSSLPPSTSRTWS